MQGTRAESAACRSGRRRGARRTLWRVDDEIAASGSDRVDDGVALRNRRDVEAERLEDRGRARRREQVEAELGQRLRDGPRSPACRARAPRESGAARRQRPPGRPLGLCERGRRSAALAITSPVERISGPSTGSEPGKRANGSTAALTLTSSGRRSSGSSSSCRRAPAASRTAASTRLTPIALLANGTVLGGARVDLDHADGVADEGELDVEQADDAERRPKPADDVATSA